MYKKVDTIVEIKNIFPSPADVDADTLARAEDLKRRFLATHATWSGWPSSDSFGAKYRRLFSREGLKTVSPEDFKYFGNSSIAAHPGNMSVFNTAWNELGAEEAAPRVRESIHYMLHTDDGSYIEERLTNLIEGGRGFGMTGFREALLTKVLCMVEQERFLPILTYTGNAGKLEIGQQAR